MRFASLLTFLVVSAVSHAAEPTVDELLRATDDVARGESSVAVMEMHVKTARYERTMKMQTWAEGTDKTLVRILEPAKERGVATLKVDDNIWNYLPKVDRTMKVPAGMMSGAWMGSHFSNDDLVKESRLSDDYSGEITAPATEGNPYEITLTPKPEAPVVWGSVKVRVTADKLPVDVRYFDEKGTLVRTMSFSQVQEINGRSVPMVMRLDPADKPGEFTEVRYESIDFDAAIPASTFTQQALKP